MVTDICIAPRDTKMVEWLDKDYIGRPIVCRVRRVGPYFIEIHTMGFNLRVLVTEATALDPSWAMTGHAWCYPKELGFQAVAGFVWGWDFCVADPAAVNPPGPWIKAVHSGVYREPRIGQRGPDSPPSITCPQCGRRSHHPKDVSERYCGNCHQFHDTMELP